MVGYVSIADGPSEYLRHSPIMKLDSGLTGANRRTNHFTVRQFCYILVQLNKTIKLVPTLTKYIFQGWQGDYIQMQRLI